MSFQIAIEAMGRDNIAQFLFVKGVRQKQIKNPSKGEDLQNKKQQRQRVDKIQEFCVGEAKENYKERGSIQLCHILLKGQMER